MCVAIPGKIIEIDKDTAKIDVMGNTTEVNVTLVDAKPGDYVLVHAGVAIEVMEKDSAHELLSLFSELDGLAEDEK